ncbi:MAG TPA: hypothetical protein VJ698_17380 [Noviherbaspirillum sp.]|nr:hypothetical protein [Noviherbaspirillum sp.]
MEPGAEAVVRDAGFDSAAPLAAVGGVLSKVARTGAAAASFVTVSREADFSAGVAADFTLLFTVGLPGLAIGFVAAVVVFETVSDALVVVFGLLAAVLVAGLLVEAVELLLFVAAVPAAPLALLAAALFVVDLVPVALMVSS